MADHALTFSVSRVTSQTEIELMPNGSDVEVTWDNLEQYAILNFNYILGSHQIDAFQSFIEGVHSIVPLKLLAILTPAELQILVCGKTNIDVDELEKHASYKGFTEKEDSCYKEWLWSCIRGMNDDDKVLFFTFITGSTAYPPGGCPSLTICLRTGARDAKLLPVSHTCTYQLDISRYCSAEEMENKLRLAIAQQGFQLL